MQPDSGSGAFQLESYVELIRSRLPVAPENLVNTYVRWAPWVAIVFGILGVIAFLLLSLLSTVLLPIFALGGASGIHAGGMALIESLVGIVVSVLDIVGGVLMLQRRELGWWILAFGITIGMLTDLLHVAVLTLAITLLIAYLHIEARPQYH